MNGPAPAPDFDAQNYSRPNQNWTCGHACEGRACRSGPDAWGRCQATTECRPVLDLKPGETKGRWRCTRSGGACESGPLPDGTCCRPPFRCSPVPTLRVWRGRITLAVIAVALATLLLLAGNSPFRDRFLSPGELSHAHSGQIFAALAATNGLNPGCGACHIAGNAGPHGFVQAALRAEPAMFDLKALAAAQPGEPVAMDADCLKCHTGRNVHQANAPAISCAFCHAEHAGMVMAATTDASCNFCHGNPVTMAVARPPTVIHHFAGDHPQFRFITEKQADPDTLKFNHALHLTGSTIPKLPGGTKLDCAYCHQPDAAGAFMRPVKFETSCRVCHSLQFDPETPQLTLPHGSRSAVAAFLHSLPKQYADLAAREQVADVDGFVRSKLTALQAQVGNGEDLEARVFFSNATTGPDRQVGTVSGASRAIFPGCAYCHEVKATAAGLAQITPPVIPEHWLAHAKFNHAKHAGITCAQCHDASHSHATADILLPAKETCATCHSPAGGVNDTCAECHTYHKPQMPQIAARD